MKKSRAVVPLAFLVLLGSWLRAPLAGAARAGQADTKGGSGAASAASAAPTASIDSAPAPAHDTGDAGDAIDLLGESFGLDFSTEALQKRVTDALAIARAGDGAVAAERQRA